MNNKFDELTRSLAQSVTRRGALKKFGIGLAGMALACFGLANKAEASVCDTRCHCDTRCAKFDPTHGVKYLGCYRNCCLACRPF